MFFLNLAFVTLATTALATPVKRAGSLAVDLKVVEAKVASINDIELIATVTNTGSKDIRVLKYGTVLDKLPTRSFHVTKDGAEVAFTGIKMQVDIAQTSEDAYAVIPAGKSVSVTHKVAETYDFAGAGIGSFKFEAVGGFPVAEASAKATAVESYFRVEAPAASAVSVEVTKDVATRGHEKRAVVSCSNSSRASFISASYSEAKSLASIASSWISANSGSSLYTSYYKTNSATNVRNVFNAVNSENSSQRTMSCTDAGGYCTSGVIAYTFTASPQNMVFCSIFFNELPTTALCSGTSVASRNIRGGTTLHELTHAVAGTVDVGYGCAADQSLSAANQYKNADNYNCFSTQVYQNTRC